MFFGIFAIPDSVFLTFLFYSVELQSIYRLSTQSFFIKFSCQPPQFISFFIKTR